MYKNIPFAEDKTKVLISILIFILIIIFPIFLRVNLCKSNEKIYFRFKLFSLISIFYGEININTTGIVLKIYNRKSINISYSKILNFKENIKPLRDYHLLNLGVYLKFGVENLENSLVIASLFQPIIEIVNITIKQLKPYVDFSTYIDIYENSKKNSYLISAVFVFNLLTVVLSLIKKLLGKVFIWKKQITDSKQ